MPSPPPAPGVPTNRVLAIAGSLQPDSTNAVALRALERLAPATLAWERWAAIEEVPAYRADLDVGDGPPAVASLRAALATAGGLCIATPEYAHSFPGALKNALDWLVSSGSLYLKPVVLLSAGSSGGSRAMGALAQTLHAQGAVLADTVPIPGVRTMVDERGELVDDAVLARLAAAGRRLEEMVDGREPVDPEAGDRLRKAPHLDAFPPFFGDPEPAGPSDLRWTVVDAADGRRVGFRSALADADLPWTTRPGAEYVTVVAGEVEVWLGQATVRLGPGDELVVPAGTRQGGRAGAGSRSVHVFAAASPESPGAGGVSPA